MQRYGFVAVVVGVVSCAAPLPATPVPSAPPVAPVPPAAPQKPVAYVPPPNGFAALAAEGWLNPRVSRDTQGRVENVRFLEVKRSAFIEGENGPKHVASFVAAHGALFGYGALGVAGRSFVASEEHTRLAVVTFPKAERCPGLEVGLVYTTVSERGTLLGIPAEWVVFCPDPARPYLDIGARVQSPGNFRPAVATARQSGADPLVAWLVERGAGQPTFYDELRGVRRIGLAGGATMTAPDPLATARAIAQKVVELEKLPPLDREVIRREKSKKDARVSDVSFSQSHPAIDARHIAPSVVVSFSVPYDHGPQHVIEITIDAEVEPPGPRPPADRDRVLPSSFPTSPEFLLLCTTSGGMIPMLESTLVDRRGDIYEMVGAPRSYAEDDIRRALRRGKRYIGALDAADTDTLAAAVSRVAVAKPEPRSVIPDASTTSCVFFRRGLELGVLEAVPERGSTPREKSVVLTKELVAVENRINTLRARERIR